MMTNHRKRSRFQRFLKPPFFRENLLRLPYSGKISDRSKNHRQTVFITAAAGGYDENQRITTG